MRFETTYKLEDYILNTKWEDLPLEVLDKYDITHEDIEKVTKDGRTLVSDLCEPRGEAKENIGVDWLFAINSDVLQVLYLQARVKKPCLSS